MPTSTPALSLNLFDDHVSAILTVAAIFIGGWLLEKAIRKLS